MLQARRGLEILRVGALHALDKLLGVLRIDVWVLWEEEGRRAQRSRLHPKEESGGYGLKPEATGSRRAGPHFARRLLATPPAGVAEDVDVWRPECEAMVDLPVGPVIVLAAALEGGGLADRPPERAVVRRGDTADLWKRRGEARASNAM